MTPSPRTDLTDQKFGLWTVLSYSHYDTDERRHYWLCRCQCGTESVLRQDSFRYGNSKSCAKCYANRRIVVDQGMIGKRFGSWIILSYDHYDRSTQDHYW